MLSTAAWNAFLKTLEEPPPNTVFVLATTEAQKVPATVIDRCHRFDFQRPTRRADRDRGRAQRERRVDRDRRRGGRRARPPRLRQLPRRARHARAAADLRRRRDRARRRARGARDLRRRAAVRGASTRSPPPTRAARCAAVAGAVDGGHDPAAFIRELEAHARELLVVQMLGGEVPPELSLTPERDERLAAQAAAPGRRGAGAHARPARRRADRTCAPAPTRAPSSSSRSSRPRAPTSTPASPR